MISLVNRNTGHPNVLRLYEWFDAPEYYVLVLERPEHCRDLSDFCSPQNKMDEQLARVVIQQLIDALLHCQQLGAFDRDVKPANVLINTDTNRVTLIDFGVRTYWTDTPYTSFAGTLAFTLPGWFRSRVYQAGPATVWSLGVTLYNIVSMADFMERYLAPQVELPASLEELRHHPWLRPSCVQSVGFRKSKTGAEEGIQQRRSPSDSPVPAESLQRGDDVDNQESWIQSLPPSSPGGVSRGSEEELLSEHGRQSAVLQLSHEQSGAPGSSPAKPAEERLSEAHSRT